MNHHQNFSTPPEGTDCSRVKPRAQLVIVCEVRQSSRPWQMVHLDDLSPSGFLITGLSQPSLDKPLSIRIPGMQLLSARICWHRGNQVGCEFAAPLHVAVFDHLVRQANQGLAVGG